MTRRAGGCGGPWCTGGCAAGDFGAAGFCATGAADFVAIGAAGFPGAAFDWMALSTSPGFEIFERSNFGFTSSGVAALCALLADFEWLADFAKCLRTFSASSASSEL